MAGVSAAQGVNHLMIGAADLNEPQLSASTFIRVRERDGDAGQKSQPAGQSR